MCSKPHCHNIQEQGSMCSNLSHIQEQGSMCSNLTVTYRNKDQCVQTSLSQYTGTRINVFKLHCHNIQEQGSMCSNFTKRYILSAYLMEGAPTCNWVPPPIKVTLTI